MSKCPHTDFKKRQKLMVTMNDGHRYLDKFVEKKSGVVILADSGRVSLRGVRAITIFRGQAICQKSKELLNA